jgi:hypothetical protein
MECTSRHPRRAAAAVGFRKSDLMLFFYLSTLLLCRLHDDFLDDFVEEVCRVVNLLG